MTALLLVVYFVMVYQRVADAAVQRINARQRFDLPEELITALVWPVAMAIDIAKAMYGTRHFPRMW